MATSNATSKDKEKGTELAQERDAAGAVGAASSEGTDPITVAGQPDDPYTSRVLEDGRTQYVAPVTVPTADLVGVKPDQGQGVTDTVDELFSPTRGFNDKPTPVPDDKRIDTH